jgi:hypothetical protein
MNLFKKHKKFEEQLQKQLNDMEVKPSLSLWERIDSGLGQNDFELGIQNSIENFEQLPSPENWEKIAAELPAEKVNIRFLRYYFMAVVAILFASGMYVVNKIDQIREKEQNSLELETGITNQNFNNSNIQQRYSNIKPAENVELQIQSTKNQLSINNFNKAVTATITQNSIVSSTPVYNTITKEYKGSKIKLATPESNVKIDELPSHILANTVINTTTTNPIFDNFLIESTEKQDSNNNLQTIKNSNDSNIVLTNEQTNSIERPREVIQLKPDSTLLAQQIAALKEQPNQNEPSPFSISLFVGVHLSYTTYSSPNGSMLNFDQNIAFRKQLERPSIDWAGGFMVDYRLTKKWMLSSGMMMVNFNQKFDYDVTPATSPANPNEIGAPISSPQDSILIGNQYSNRIRYTWTEIPIFINYKVKNAVRWDFDLQGGISYAFINTIDGGMVSYDNKGVLILRGKESFPQISNAVFITAMPQLSCKFGQAVSVGIVPTVKYSLNSIVGNDRWIQQHPYFIGINFCLRKRF